MSGPFAVQEPPNVDSQYGTEREEPDVENRSNKCKDSRPASSSEHPVDCRKQAGGDYGSGNQRSVFVDGKNPILMTPYIFAQPNYRGTCENQAEETINDSDGFIMVLRGHNRFERNYEALIREVMKNSWSNIVLRILISSEVGDSVYSISSGIFTTALMLIILYRGICVKRLDILNDACCSGVQRS
jgi:hypothetical protein